MASLSRLKDFVEELHIKISHQNYLELIDLIDDVENDVKEIEDELNQEKRVIGFRCS